MTSPSGTPLSVLDLSPVPSGATGRDALRNSLDLARRAEEFGYHRYWVAEHHFAEGVASSAPAVLIALIASATRTIRVGSGAVLLGYYAPVTVAEQFGTLSAAHPGRIDLGIGRSGPGHVKEFSARQTAPGAAPVAPNREVRGLIIPAPARTRFGDPAVRERLAAQQALLHGREDAGKNYLGEVREILDLIGGSFTTGDDLALRAPAAEGADAEIWLLGSSAGASSTAAGALGLPFVANYHVSPSSVLETVDAYRAAFVPTAERPRPHVMVSADVVVAEDGETARRLASPYARWVLSIRSGAGAIPFPTPEEAAAFAWTDELRDLVADRVDTQIVGDPETVVERLTALREATGADELLITTIAHDHGERVRSYELLADAWAKG
ncbi:MsnO8 family LLM class oxidoreductase [Streptomyces radicis]|uniref:MsnO8 family LLM class oxidoreductase n=1 Tax=Streptomyces radicis TaxID=1750517 RepID=A0A3A9VVJ6_9ACTN|nr:MsnO8 family LLM class oxidoreductase [Streptomyces radicis]RKN04780.1 MsnO8 family LLM class oxidoreductase [Streptomyces radicis]RKN15986.1 MsnO8 family LLM class oxidoreductase [Streptomyces radicis]